MRDKEDFLGALKFPHSCWGSETGPGKENSPHPPVTHSAVIDHDEGTASSVKLAEAGAGGWGAVLFCPPYPVTWTNVPVCRPLLPGPCSWGFLRNRDKRGHPTAWATLAGPLQIEQVSQLSALVDAQLDYHRQAVQILDELADKLKRR